MTWYCGTQVKIQNVSRRRINEWELKSITPKQFSVFTLSSKVAKQKQGHQLEKDVNPVYLGVKLDT